MKLWILVMLAGWALWQSARCADEEIPTELADLRSKYGAALGEATGPIVTKFDADLKKLQDNYLRAEQLESARAVAKVRESGLPDSELDGLPRRLVALIEACEQNLARAQRSVHETYARELKKLRKKYANAANLEAAEAVEKELKDLAGQLNPFRKEQLLGEWRYFYRGKHTDTRRFDDTHMIDSRGDRYPWKFTSDGIYIRWVHSGGFEKLTIDPGNHNVLVGVNDGGVTFHYVRPGHEPPKPESAER